MFRWAWLPHPLHSVSFSFDKVVLFYAHFLQDTFYLEHGYIIYILEVSIDMNSVRLASYTYLSNVYYLMGIAQLPLAY